MKANKIKEPEKENKEQLLSIKIDGRIAKSTKKLLGGEVITKGTFKFFPFLLFIAFLAFVYIANNYYAENKVREINQIHKELKELRYEYITSKSTLMDLGKQSRIAGRLENKGIKDSREPVKTIRLSDRSSN